MKKSYITIYFDVFLCIKEETETIFVCFNPLEQENMLSQRGECFNADWSLDITFRHVRSLRSVAFFH
jgi:hypothetical protein